MARANGSRALELTFLLGYASDSEALKNEMLSKPRGSVSSQDGVTFEWGNIERLIPFLNSDSLKTPLDVPSLCIYHLDGLSRPRKAQIESLHGLPNQALNSKADLLFVDKENCPHYISFKDGQSIAKLGQVSTSKKYGSLYLEGGIHQDPPADLPPEIFAADTALTEEQFEKLGNGVRHKKWAYFKRHQPQEWADFVNSKMAEAISQLKEFGRTISTDDASLSIFLTETIVGHSDISENFNIVIDNSVVPFKNFIEATGLANVRVREFNTPKKFSLIIELLLNDKTYGLTKIEPSFEGALEIVSQTKGIIYHFQEYSNPSTNLSYKDLMLDSI